jgi:hypothetical protein
MKASAGLGLRLDYCFPFFLMDGSAPGYDYAGKEVKQFSRGTLHKKQ